jgi:protein TonB
MNAARSATYVIQAPSPADLAENYPRKAKEAHVTGRAVILCSADQRGDTRACALVDETPKGYGFGDAAMRMGSMFKVAPQPPNQCQYAPMVVIIPIEWKAR